MHDFLLKEETMHDFINSSKDLVVFFFSSFLVEEKIEKTLLKKKKDNYKVIINKGWIPCP